MATYYLKAWESDTYRDTSDATTIVLHCEKRTFFGTVRQNVDFKVTIPYDLGPAVLVNAIARWNNLIDTQKPFKP